MSSAARALVYSPASVPEGRTETQGRRRWSRDFALVGAATGVLAPLTMMLVGYSGIGLGELAFLGGAGVTGAVSGAGLGRLMARGLSGWLGRLPLSVSLPGGIVTGALWGGAAGAAGGLAMELATGPSGYSGLVVLLGGLWGGITGGLQLGWLWLPYSVKRIREKKTGGLLALACALAPALGYAATRVLDLVF